MLCDGRLAFKMKKPSRNGATHVFMAPHQFLRRLTSLIPRRGQNQLRYFGILGPSAKHRRLVVPAAPIEIEGWAYSPGVPSYGRYRWAQMLKRVYNIDALRCPCGGSIRLICAIEDPRVIRRILDHLQQRPAASIFGSQSQGPDPPEPQTCG